MKSLSIHPKDLRVEFCYNQDLPKVPVRSISTKSTAFQAFDTYRNLHPFTHYAGILLLYGESRLALHTQEKNQRLAALKQQLLPWVNGEVSFPCNYPNYQCGGMASAWLLYKGAFPEAANAVEHHAQLLMNEAPRGELGIFCHPRPPHVKIFIDVAFAVTPFLLFAGLHFKRDEWVEEAINQTCNMCRILIDPENGLLHQAKNFRHEGHFSQDHWSRGNGWGIFALTELIQELPRNHPRYAEVQEVYLSLLKSILEYQNAEGTWHQEMTWPNSYVETSGGGLFLYALAVARKLEMVDLDATASALQRGLRSYLTYIAVDGSVHNTCRGCLCPGEGTIEDYLQREALLNDCHAFGPVSLAFGQAFQNGIAEISL